MKQIRQDVADSLSEKLRPAEGEEQSVTSKKKIRQDDLTGPLQILYRAGNTLGDFGNLPKYITQPHLAKGLGRPGQCFHWVNGRTAQRQVGASAASR